MNTDRIIDAEIADIIRSRAASLADCYDLEAVIADAIRGRYGTLCDAATAEPIRPATRLELLDSLETGPEGFYMHDGARVYVEPGGDA